jgi:hypothetical protein
MTPAAPAFNRKARSPFVIVALALTIRLGRAAAPAPPQPAATVNQANPFNSGNNANASAAAATRGVAGLTIPLSMPKPALGGVGPSGLYIPQA